MGRSLAALLAASALLAGCGGGGNEQAATVPAAACGDAAFRAQDEELYVTKTAVANALAAGGDPATLLLDLQHARKALGGYLEAHPPCAAALREIAAAETMALGALDEAVTALQQGQDARSQLRGALSGLTGAQSRLADTG